MARERDPQCHNPECLVKVDGGPARCWQNVRSRVDYVPDRVMVSALEGVGVSHRANEVHIDKVIS